MNEKLLPRAELLRAVREQMKTRTSRAEVDAAFGAVDVVLDAVLAEVTPLVENEWCGTEVLKRIRRLRFARR